MKNSALRTLALVACMGIGAALAVPSSAQTPITVQVINDSGLPDSAVYLLLAGQDVNVIPGGGPATNYPFAVSGVAKTPAGTVINTTSALVTNAATTPAASAPLSITGAASTIAMSFSPATIVAGGTSTLTINLPNVAAAQALLQPFTVVMPAGVTITPLTDTGNCGSTTVTSTQVSIPTGQNLPASGCKIIVAVTSSAPGTVTATTSFLQTGPANALPASAPLTIASGATAMTMAFQPASIAAVRSATSQLTINIPNATAAAQTLSAPFTDAMPTSVVVDTAAGNTGSCTNVALTKTQITLPQGAAVPPGGCTIIVTVKPIAAGGALSALTKSGTFPSPYTGNSLPVYEFSMSTVSSGNLFLSYNAPVEYPPAPTVTSNYRFQPLEFSYSDQIVSNGDLTSIDFYGIPLELQTFASTDPGLKRPLDRVTYYTSTPTLHRAFVNLNPDLKYAFVGAGNTVFTPGTGDDYSSFLRIIGPNQVAAPGTSPLPTGAPTGNAKPWPYPSYAGYLDKLANSGYTFNEIDNGVISAFSFNYSGSISKVAAGADEPCVPGGSTVAGWLIKLRGTTQAPSPLPSNAEICIPLPAIDPGTGSADFFIYGAVQNCESLSLYANSTLYPCSDTDTAALGAMSNSVYGWIQADVLSALNFGYMQGSADATTGNVGYSNVWYNLPPVQYPFGLARNSPDDGNYNPWAALMYNHSDAYGFAFSDRKGRPSPDIAYPIGGTLRIWILPDKRLDAPMVSAGSEAGGSTDNSIPLAWPPVEGADHYVVTWSPPYVPASATVNSTSYSITGLQPGTPYAITVTAYNASGLRSYEMPVRAMTAGPTAKPPAGNANFQFGVNWNLPTYPQLPAPQPVTLTPQSATLTVSSADWFVDTTFFPATISPGGSALLTITLGNPSLTTGATLAAAFSLSMPTGVTIKPNTQGGTCPGVSVGAASVSIAASTPLAAGGCTITATVTASAAGTYPSTTSTLRISAGKPAATVTYPAPSASLTVTTSTWYLAQTIAPGTLPSGVAPTLTVFLVNTNATALLLTAPFTVSLPAGMTTTSKYLGTCPNATLTTIPAPATITIAAGVAIPAGGCMVAVNVSATAGTLVSTPGTLQANTIPAPDVYIAGTQYFNNGGGTYIAPPDTSTPITLGTTQAFPLEVRLKGAPVWVANYYLTFEGSTGSYSVGPCGPTDVCVGPNLPANSVHFDTVGAPNFLERQGTPLSPTGGTGATGPPFGGSNGMPNIGVSFTPIANKRAAVVKYPSLGLPDPPRFDAPCGKAKTPGTSCH